MIWSEVSYKYTPAVGIMLAQTGITFRDFAYTRPRLVTCVLYPTAGFTDLYAAEIAVGQLHKPKATAFTGHAPLPVDEGGAAPGAQKFVARAARSAAGNERTLPCGALNCAVPHVDSCGRNG